MTRPSLTPFAASLGSRRHVNVVVGATLLQVATAVFAGIGFLNPLIARELGVGMAELMVYFSIYMLTSAVSMTLLGPRLTRRFGSRQVIAGAGVVTAAGLFTMSLGANLPAIYASGFLIGLAFGTATTMQASLLVNTWYEARRGVVLGLVMGLGGVGGIVLGLITPFLLGIAGWRGTLQFLAAWVLLLTVLPARFLIRSHPNDVGLQPFGAHAARLDQPHVTVVSLTLARALRSPQFWAIVLAWIVQGFNMGIHPQLAPLLVAKGLSVESAGSAIAVLSLAITCSGVALGFVFDRLGPLRTMAGAYAIQALSMVGFLTAGAYLPLLGSAVLLSVSSAMTGIIVPILLVRVFGPRDHVAILGPVMAAQSLGGALSAPLWGHVFDVFGNYDLATGVAILGSLVVGGLFAYALLTADTLKARVAAEAAPDGRLPATPEGAAGRVA